MYIDIDKKALDLTRYNLRKNNQKIVGHVFLKNSLHKKYIKKNYYDAIIANILFDPLKILVKEFKYLLKNNSYLIISGILLHQTRYIINKYRVFNFICYKIDRFVPIGFL